MHSSGLRGDDFTIARDGTPVSHQHFFASHSTRTRIGLFAPKGAHGVEAITFLMAAVTAFYDRYREAGGEFYAYPDFYSCQRDTQLADYGFLDFWPNKDVLVSDDHNETLAAINDRAIKVLLVPDSEPHELEYDGALRESAQRNLERCFVYGSGNLAFACALEPLRTYAKRMLKALDMAAPDWLDPLEQSFQELGVDAAPARL